MIAAAFWLASPMVHAAGLGQLSVISPLGQPLNAEIEIVSLQPGEEEGLVARLASPDAFRAAGIDFNPALVTARFAIERRGGRPPRLVRLSRHRHQLPRRRSKSPLRRKQKSPRRRKRRSPQRSQSASRLPRKRERSRSRRATR